MAGYLIKTKVGRREDGTRTYPPETIARLRQYSSNGFDCFVELAGYRAGGTVFSEDVWILIQREPEEILPWLG